MSGLESLISSIKNKQNKYNGGTYGNEKVNKFSHVHSKYMNKRNEPTDTQDT